MSFSKRAPLWLPLQRARMAATLSVRLRVTESEIENDDGNAALVGVCLLAAGPLCKHSAIRREEEARFPLTCARVLPRFQFVSLPVSGVTGRTCMCIVCKQLQYCAVR
jgi:hypothetical protein